VIRSREKRLIQRCRKIRGGQKQDIAVLPRKAIHARQHGVGCAMDIDRIGIETQFVARDCQRLHLVQQHYRGAAHR